MTYDKEDLITVVTNAGWHKGRNIGSKIENTILYKMFPKKVQDFLCEFGDLKIHADNKIQTITISTNHFNNKEVFDYHNDNAYKLNDKIDLTDDRNENYYYSVLIGLQLYPIAKLIEQSTLLMDENGNFYVINFIPELIWISNDTFEALSKITFGSMDVAIFNEHKMQWMVPAESNFLHTLPVNYIFKENPW